MPNEYQPTDNATLQAQLQYTDNLIQEIGDLLNIPGHFPADYGTEEIMRQIRLLKANEPTNQQT